MHVREFASKHGVSVQRILSLLDEVGIEGKQDTSLLDDSELKKLESRLVASPRRGAVKILRPTVGTPIVRRKPAPRRHRPKAGETQPSAGHESEQEEGLGEKTGSRLRTPDVRRSQAGSKARNLLRVKRMRESGITRPSPEPSPPLAPEASSAQAVVEKPGGELKEIQTVAPKESLISQSEPVLDRTVAEATGERAEVVQGEPEPLEVGAATGVEGRVEEPTEQAKEAGETVEGVVAVAEAPVASPEEASKAAKGKRGKSKKQKQEEIIETSKERITSVQERKVLASILGQKKGKKQKYKRTKRERFAAVEEAQKEREERQRTTLQIHEATTVADVAHGLDKKPSDILKILLDLGKIVTVNQRLDHECIEIIADEFGFEIERTSLLDLDRLEDFDEASDPADVRLRPPVVTVMGHVDHGKTKLLDAIRSADVTSTEAGGITQHIGAYYVHQDNGDVCFLDTPGHEAFTAMRARGAVVTDVVVLVVAADDGIMPQTKEAIAHARAAEVPILVAINKIDLPGANVERVKQQLAAENLVPEEWGGNTPVAEISALKKIGIDQLVELIHIQAELLELKANPKKRARGTVLEARLEEGRGVVVTALVQDGTLQLGDAVVTGVYSGKVRALINEHNKRTKKATPGSPVMILGLSGIPVAGDELRAVPSERMARELAHKLQQLRREREMAKVARVSLESLFNRIEEGTVKELRLVVKGDVDGSVGAVCESIERIESDKVKVRILHRGVGAISDSDVMLASASEAIVLGFGVTTPPDVAATAEGEGVDVRTYRVIYDAIEDIKKAMVGLLEDEERQVVVGQLEVVQVFRSTKAGLILGGEVTEGKLVRGANLRVLRDGRIVYEGKIATLRRFKEEASEVTQGLECGVGIEGFQDAKKGDILECYQVEQVAATL